MPPLFVGHNKGVLRTNSLPPRSEVFYGQSDLSQNPPTNSCHTQSLLLHQSHPKNFPHIIDPSLTRSSHSSHTLPYPSRILSFHMPIPSLRLLLHERKPSFIFFLLWTIFVDFQVHQKAKQKEPCSSPDESISLPTLALE